MHENIHAWKNVAGESNDIIMDLVVQYTIKALVLKRVFELLELRCRSSMWYCTVCYNQSMGHFQHTYLTQGGFDYKLCNLTSQRCVLKDNIASMPQDDDYYYFGLGRSYRHW